MRIFLIFTLIFSVVGYSLTKDLEISGKSNIINTVNNFNNSESFHLADIFNGQSTFINFIWLGDWGKGKVSNRRLSNLQNVDVLHQQQSNQAYVAEAINNFVEKLMGQSYYSTFSTSKITSPLEISLLNNDINSQESVLDLIISSLTSSTIFNAPISAIIALGDNFYNNGVSSTNDYLWEDLWREIYLNPYPNLSQIPWYAVLGNHDYGGGDTYAFAQVQRMYEQHKKIFLSNSNLMEDEKDVKYKRRLLEENSLSSSNLLMKEYNSANDITFEVDQWHLPAKNYSVKFESRFDKNKQSTFLNFEPLKSNNFESRSYYKRTTLFQNEVSVTIIFVDTTTLAPSLNKCCNENGGVSEGEQKRRVQEQLEYLNQMFEEATENPSHWLIVAGHYPIYSAGSQGDVNELLEYLDPLLVKYKVHAYFCGHDHISEHLVKDNIHYFVSGAGSMTDSLKYYNPNGVTYTPKGAELLWYGVDYSAFSFSSSNTTHMLVQFISMDNTLKYEYILDNPHEVKTTATKNDKDIENSKTKSKNSFFSNNSSEFNISSKNPIVILSSIFSLIIFILILLFLKGFFRRKQEYNFQGNMPTNSSSNSLNHDYNILKNDPNNMVMKSIKSKELKNSIPNNSLRYSSSNNSSPSNRNSSRFSSISQIEDNELYNKYNNFSSKSPHSPSSPLSPISPTSPINPNSPINSYNFLLSTKSSSIPRTILPNYELYPFSSNNINDNFAAQNYNEKEDSLNPKRKSRPNSIQLSSKQSVQSYYNHHQSSPQNFPIHGTNSFTQTNQNIRPKSLHITSPKSDENYLILEESRRFSLRRAVSPTNSSSNSPLNILPSNNIPNPSVHLNDDNCTITSNIREFVYDSLNNRLDKVHNISRLSWPNKNLANKNFQSISQSNSPSSPTNRSSLNSPNGLLASPSQLKYYSSPSASSSTQFPLSPPPITLQNKMIPIQSPPPSSPPPKNQNNSKFYRPLPNPPTISSSPSPTSPTIIPTTNSPIYAPSPPPPPPPRFSTNSPNSISSNILSNSLQHQSSSINYSNQFGFHNSFSSIKQDNNNDSFRHSNNMNSNNNSNNSNSISNNSNSNNRTRISGGYKK